MHDDLEIPSTDDTTGVLRPGLLILAGCFLLLIGGCQSDPETVGPTPEYEPIAERLRAFIQHERKVHDLPAFSIALVDNQDIVWAEGFGMADPDAEVPATAETVHRVGSVSKLFTDVAIMQRVEDGELDLDAPVSTYLSDFRPENPYDKSITLRQLMTHRSGLIREPRVGHYFDSSEFTLAESVRSLNASRLVYRPETHTKYSNAGIKVVGRVLEVTQDQSFPTYMEQAVLDPMGLDDSAFELTSALKPRLATAYMWTYDGRRFEAPTFPLTAPDANLYSTVTDLGQFMKVLFAGGEGPDGNMILQSETLEQMWTPQYAEGREGYGLGFYLTELKGHRQIQHGGAAYGFATEFVGLPEQKLGVAAVTTLDFASAPDHVGKYALKLMLAAKEGRPLPPVPHTQPVDSARASALVGTYENGDRRVELFWRRGTFMLDQGEVQVQLRSLGDTLITDGRLDYGVPVVPLDGPRIVVDGDTLTRVQEERPAPIPSRWEGLIGEYGWDYNTLYVREENGQLHVLIEWFMDYPLTEVARDTFAFPERGMYPGDRLVFTRDSDGRATQVAFEGGTVFERRSVGPAEGETFRITPVEPVEKLRQEALEAEPPSESGSFRDPELVDLKTLDSSIKVDLPYASTDNFMGARFYEQQKAFLQRPAAEALVRVHDRLKEKGYGLLIYDAYRPWFVTKMFWEATPSDKKQFVANPEEGSRHNRGSAVDLTLYDRQTGQSVAMPSGYDEFTPRAYAHYPGGTEQARWHRDVLREVMAEEGFTVYEKEWWHFDHKEWRKYPILNKTFDEVASDEEVASDG